MKKANSILKYIYIPITFALLGYGTVYAAFFPVLEMAGSVGRMIISDSAPDFNTEFLTIYDPEAHKSVQIHDNTIVETTIQKPEYGNIYANIECEELQMNEAIYWGDTKEILKVGIGQYSGSYFPGYGGTMLICGHNVSYGKYIKDTRIGMVYKVKTNYGEFEYEVYDIKIMNAAEAESQVFKWLLEEEEKLVYYTCYPFDAFGITPQRCFVFAKKISGPVVDFNS